MLYLHVVNEATYLALPWTGHIIPFIPIYHVKEITGILLSYPINKSIAFFAVYKHRYYTNNDIGSSFYPSVNKESYLSFSIDNNKTSTNKVSNLYFRIVS